jgi:WS/DGAT/MGAT family acyltransferase
VSEHGRGQRLSPVDSSFLRLESPRAQMHIGWSAIFDVPPGCERPTLERLRERAAARLHWVPRSRQRLDLPPHDFLGEPRWVDDPHFDVAQHIVSLTDPAWVLSTEGFASIRDAVLSQCLKRDRPLWQIALVPRLEDGRMAVVGRVHHAVADGMAAMAFATLLLDLGPEGPPDEVPEWVPAAAPRRLRWAAEPAVDGVRLTRDVVRGSIRAVRRPRTTASATGQAAGRIAVALRQDAVIRAPASFLNGVNGPRRTLVGCQLPLGDLHAVKVRAGGTTNDVALAVVSGALRRLSIESGRPTCDLKAMIPVSTRGTERQATLGNRISQAMIQLPLEVEDGTGRLARVREQTERFKQSQRPDGSRLLLEGLGLFRGPARDALLKAAASPRAYNLVVSSIRGPQSELRMLGTRLDELLPVVPAGRGHALSIGMFSYAGQLHIGLHADPDALPEVALLPELLIAELQSLQGTHVAAAACLGTA